MGKYRFLFSVRWVSLFLLALLASLVCLYLAQWQMGRKEALDYSNERISQNYDAQPLDFSSDPALFSKSSSDLRWHPVALEGHYLADEQLLVRHRPFKGLNGFEVLVPFQTLQGPIVLVDRGWVEAAFGDASAPAGQVPAAPSGQVRLVVRLVEGEIDRGDSALAGQVGSIDLPEIAQMTGLDLEQAQYGVLASEDPAPATAPLALERPEEDYGPNLSYSVQWYCFAGMFLLAYAWSARQKVRNDELDAQVLAELGAYFGQFYDQQGRYIGQEDEQLVRRRMDFFDDMPAHMRSIVRPKLPSSSSAAFQDELEEDAIVDRLYGKDSSL